MRYRDRRVISNSACIESGWNGDVAVTNTCQQVLDLGRDLPADIRHDDPSSPSTGEQIINGLPTPIAAEGSQRQSLLLQLDKLFPEGGS
jgi:hypothetical protein